MSTFITKRRLFSLVSASALFSSMALAAVPASTMAASACTETGFVRDGINLTAARIGGAISGSVDATGCDIALYNPTSVVNADIHGARYFGIVADGIKLNTTNSKVHQIGEQPFDGTQHGRAILYINGASGTISGNKVYDFQKNGIEISGLNAAGDAASSAKTSATIAKNVITGQGHIDYIAQNGIVIRNGASAIVNTNTISKLWYTPADTEATGLLNYEVGKIMMSAGNKFSDTEVRVYGVVTSNVQGWYTTSVRPHAVRVDLRSYAKPATQTVLGTKLDWKIKVDGSTRLHTKQGFSAHSVYYENFKVGSGRHVIRILKNDHIVRTIVVRF